MKSHYVIRAAATASAHAGGLRRTLIPAGDAEASEGCTKLGEGQAAGWEYFTFAVTEEMQSFELCVEAECGVLVLQRAAKPDDSALDGVEEERRITLLRAQAGVMEAQSRADEAAELYAEIRRHSRPKVVTQMFPARGQFVQIQVVSPKCSFEARANALVHSPAHLHGETFPGVWHIGVRGHGPRKQMHYKLGIRWTLRQVEQRRARPRAAAVQQPPPENAPQHQQRVEGDRSGGGRVRWEPWNKVKLAQELQLPFAGTFYPPKMHLNGLKMQSVVRGFLARKRIRYALRVSEATSEQQLASLRLRLFRLLLFLFRLLLLLFRLLLLLFRLILLLFGLLLLLFGLLLRRLFRLHLLCDTLPLKFKSLP